MLEIEMKFRVADFKAVRAKLKEWKAAARDAHDERDHYFNAPDRNFARTDEALRLRRIGSKNVATYKGPKEAGPTKTREEIEVPLADGAEAAVIFRSFLLALGYRSVADIRKKRKAYRFKRQGFALEVCLDEVKEVGRFVEVEIVAPDEKKQQAQAVLQEIAADLKLEVSERRSYLELYLSRDPES